MKTPYDTAMRVRQREVDQISAAISAEANALAQTERRGEEVSAAMRREADLAAADFGVSAHAYLARQRAERQRLAQDRVAISGRLETMRAKAVEAFSSLRAIENAAAAYRAEAERIEASAEQAEVDDRSAATVAGARRAAAGKAARVAAGRSRS
ncbi:hypothetical protein I5E68_02975 [Novosphingobium sp. YJ-S2-02]|uniref:Flagellar export protein FliJ n=1 Tax=Novosphingobium aureum TaxID=2792964 RepID=A0A931HAF8_9SPHN|nr:hypothetical protein [Novosphingobium aureum]MBH0111914.1 hypothetical protein [Novosphingobium aureum]